jgi:hypothetical protein
LVSFFVCFWCKFVLFQDTIGRTSWNRTGNLGRIKPKLNETLSFRRAVFGSRRFLLFSERLSKKQAVFFPNSSKKEKSGGAAGKGGHNDLILSNQILEAAKV